MLVVVADFAVLVLGDDHESDDAGHGLFVAANNVWDIAKARCITNHLARIIGRCFLIGIARRIRISRRHARLRTTSVGWPALLDNVVLGR